MSDKIMKALRALIKQRVSDDFPPEVLIAMAARDESPSHDRALALVGIVYLEDALKIAISKYFAPIRPAFIDNLLFDDEEAPLGTLAAKARLAVALGIVNEDQRKDLNVLRLIRNVFGHSLYQVSFLTKEIDEGLKSLILLKDANFEKPGISPTYVARVRFITQISAHLSLLAGHRGGWKAPLPPETQALIDALNETQRARTQEDQGQQPDTQSPPAPPPRPSQE